MPVIKIKGMTCDHCVMTVTKALNEIEGIKNVRVDLNKGEAFFDGKSINMDLVREKIKEAGYKVV
jgi:copper chaperone